MVACFYIVSLRWKPPKMIMLDEANVISGLSSFIPQAVAEARVEQLNRLVANQCPSHHVDFYVFTIAVLCVICSAIFTFVARSLHISMWCPLLLLLIPTALSFWTSKRRSTLIVKIKEFESALKKTLYEYTATDQNLKWTLQRVPIDEAPCTSVRFSFVIHITELDPEMVYVGEELPSYQAALLNTATPFHPPSYHELTAPPHAVVVS
ncbi:hypothetical protein MUCCIDRAFT_108555 [Mucor lusitanicus CBS 277.49]|uniref:Uncharacterized protein n=1 Tax=Mucor lusitanicus CBS 277.49 TaxID=747725 RepID=A0A162THZ0_MUCCL|nr:hypothetical protein MUCCIDRAFT_108555 [Mucor lusitanicus CBS 277.49]